MTVTAHAGVAGPYLADGVQATFPVPFALPAAADLTVLLRAPDGAETVVDPASVSVVGDGWARSASVTLKPPPAAGTGVTLVRRMAHDQPADFQRHGVFQADRVEAQLDRTVLLTQQLSDRIDRAPLLPVTSGVRDIVLAEPVPATVLRWSDDGRSLIPWAATADVTTVAAMAPDIAAVLAVAPAVEAVVDRTAVVETVAGMAVTLDALAPHLPVVADRAADIEALGSRTAALDGVAGSTAALDGLAPVAAEIASLAPIVAEIATIAGNLGAVVTVADGMDAVDGFANRYLAAGAVAPTQRPDGAPLQAGDLYFDTGVPGMMAFDGVSWTQVAPGAAPMLPLAGGTLTGPVAIVPGSAAAPGLALSGDSDTGLAAAAGGGLAIVTDGTVGAVFAADGMALGGAVGGRLGAGTLNAGGLAVNGDSVLTAASGLPALPDRVARLERNLELLALRQEAAVAAGPRGLLGGTVDGFVDATGLALPVVTAVGPRNMTGPIQGTIAVTASSLGMPGDPAFEAWTAFDGITDPGNNGWAATVGLPDWLQVDYGPAGAIVNRYEIDGHISSGFNIRDWVVEASQDAVAWTQLDNRAGYTDWVTVQNKTFDFPNRMAYRYYRWTITADQGFDQAYFTEMRLSHRSVGTENAAQDPATDTVAAVDPALPWQAVSVARTAAIQPEAATVTLDLDPGSATANGTVVASVSRDGGTTWTDAVLTDRLDLSGGRRLWVADAVDLSGQPAGTAVKLMVAVAGGQTVLLHGWALTWR